MPQPLRRKKAPIEWDLEVVANHPVLSSGVGACILAYAQAEAVMGIYLAHIQWQDPCEAVTLWANQRSAERKLVLIQERAEVRGAGAAQLTSLLLDSFLAVAKEQAKLAHGVFGVITDRDDEFAWRSGGTPAKAHAVGRHESHWGVVEQQTYVYRSADFARLAQQCSDISNNLGRAIRGLTIFDSIQASESMAGS